MKLFLDSSVLLAAAGSTSGASRLLVSSARHGRWTLLTSEYCVREVEHNIAKLGPKALWAWSQVGGTSLVLDRPMVYRAVKDRPVVITALSMNVDYLLTLDWDDFHDLLGSAVYGLPIRTPGEFLRKTMR